MRFRFQVIVRSHALGADDDKVALLGDAVATRLPSMDVAMLPTTFPFQVHVGITIDRKDDSFERFMTMLVQVSEAAIAVYGIEAYVGGGYVGSEPG